MMTCLCNHSTGTILNKEWVSDDYFYFNWAQSFDQEIVSDNPVNMIKQGSVLKKDVLLGVNKDEGSSFITVEVPSQFSQVLHHYTFIEGVEYILSDVANKTRAEVIDG